jgi:hypothetical protein
MMPGGEASDGGTGIANGDFFGDRVRDTVLFFLAEAVGEPFFLFFAGVGVFFVAGFFFFGDVFALGVGDLAGVAEVSAALCDLSVDETCE